MKPLSFLVAGILTFLPSGLAPAKPAAPQAGIVAGVKSKSCTLPAPIGNEGCTVTLKIRKKLDANGNPEACSAADTTRRFCVSIVVNCPAGIPMGDPGESCESLEDCNLCGSSDATVSVSTMCDGQTFTLKPKANKKWMDIWCDCEEMEASAS